jgi:hypothetical protein
VCCKGEKDCWTCDFFNETINCDRYVQVILGQFFLELTEGEDSGWFQQDPATAHTARISMQVLSDVFSDRIISGGIWPAHSPDLDPCDFFFWSYLKENVYKSNPRTEEELKKIFVGKLQIFLQNSFKGQISTSSAGASNVYMYRDSIFSTSCDL